MPQDLTTTIEDELLRDAIEEDERTALLEELRSPN
jgi:hypothetical protein